MARGVYMSNDIKSIAEIDLREIAAANRYFPSPEDWEDQVLYFLIADRFSNRMESAGTAALSKELAQSSDICRIWTSLRCG